jgi:hypothetical protein
MKGVLYLSAVVLLAVCATWAYRVNYATQDALNHIADLRDEIAEESEALGVLRAEWAYLNRPDRLRELVAANAGALGLVELTPEQFGEVTEAPFPAPPPPPDPSAVEEGTPSGPEGANERAPKRPTGHAALAPAPINGAFE